MYDGMKKERDESRNASLSARQVQTSMSFQPFHFQASRTSNSKTTRAHSADGKQRSHESPLFGSLFPFELTTMNSSDNASDGLLYPGARPSSAPIRLPRKKSYSPTKAPSPMLKGVPNFAAIHRREAKKMLATKKKLFTPTIPQPFSFCSTSTENKRYNPEDEYLQKMEAMKEERRRLKISSIRLRSAVPTSITTTMKFDAEYQHNLKKLELMRQQEELKLIEEENAYKRSTNMYVVEEAKQLRRALQDKVASIVRARAIDHTQKNLTSQRERQDQFHKQKREYEEKINRMYEKVSYGRTLMENVSSKCAESQNASIERIRAALANKSCRYN